MSIPVVWKDLQPECRVALVVTLLATFVVTLAFAYLVGIGSLVGFSTFVWLIKHSTPARVSTYAYVNPVVAVFLGWLILGEPITHRTLVASVVIVTAVVVITVQKNRATKPKV